MTKTPRAYDRSTLQADLEAVHAKGVPGLLAAAHTGREVLTARCGSADRASDTPIAHDSSFRMGSTGKTFTAVVVLQLVGEGRLSLDDTVEDRLPGVVRGNGNDGTRITVRRLLQQTSGLAEYIYDVPIWSTKDFQEHRYDSYTSEELVAMAMRHEPKWLPEPGDQRWSYTNTNYVLAGMIIEKVTGNRRAEEVRDRIIRPLGLDGTFAPGDDPRLPDPHPRGYTEFPDSAEPVETTEVNPTPFDAAGDLITTAPDLMRFWQALLGGGLLAPAQLAAMKQTVPAAEWDSVWPGARYGLGIGRFPSSCGAYWGHAGNTPGHTAHSGFTEDGSRGMVLFTTLWAPNENALPVEKLINDAIDRLVCDRAGT
ncbi:serine hydrolase [Nocardiopsis sp. RSe5-2]|uniref:Serine hydrolase n=1 Tax=Nocardiopsis endophytica TaxID=3018445 RepID=A0ABT4U3H8_9ACTN|nr:serine hydrolase domain-containing protein [Nocardiopsis endophytica]MDA2811518.1 serine hydrolase [Nocardiopsis endophytica]